MADIPTLAKKFAANPASLTDAEIAALAAGFDLAHPDAAQLIEIANGSPQKWHGLRGAIARADWERKNFEQLTQNPFASRAEIEATPKPSELGALPQAELAKMIFGA